MKDKYILVDPIVKFGEGLSCTGCVFDGGPEKGCLAICRHDIPDCCTDKFGILILNPEYKEITKNNP